MLWIILAIIISYLAGSVPTAYIFGRIIKGTDIRKFGSGNVGATNALRLLGKGWGVTVLVLDILKGVAAQKNIVGFDLVELSPIKGLNHPDFTAAKLIYKLMGYISSKPL